MSINSAMVEGPCDRLVEGMRAEFGAVLAARILEAEALDFLWDARLAERYCGQHFGPEDEGESELSRVAVLSFLDGAWHAALCLADGEGAAAALLWRRRCDRRDEALALFERAA